MKRLLALLGVSAMIGFSAPAYADPRRPSGDDAGFLAALRQAGIDYANAGSSHRVRQSGVHMLE